MEEKIATPFLSCKITRHCNRKCDHCDSFSPWSKPWCVNLRDLEQDIKILARRLSVGTLFINGGEPLLHPHFLEILEMIRETGLAWNVDLLTNGDLLERMPDRAWGLLNTVQVTQYPDSHWRWNLQERQQAAQRRGCQIRITRRNEFQIIWIHQKHKDPKQTQKIWDTCSLKNLCLEMRDGFLYRCAPHAIFQERQRIDKIASDALNFRDQPLWWRDFDSFLKQTQPLEACHWCWGSQGPKVPVKQIPPSELNQRPFRDPSIDVTDPLEVP